MIKGNFSVSIAGVDTHVDYVVEPPLDTFKDYDFIIYPSTVIVPGNATPDVPMVFQGALINLVNVRVNEQTSLSPKYVGITVK